jgi:demethylmenaquinone methyltransferase/2-methoxy-6-polyprenyl-1,4-benzoquinol methylase
LVDYYRRRAAEYELIFAKPERQADLKRLRLELASAFRAARVLEVACGTGYWTAVIAGSAASVVATDLAEEPMRIAQAKPYPERNVRFSVSDAYVLPETLGRFDAAFAGFWWSHVPLARLEEFLASLHARLEPGARVLMLDNRYVEGNSTPIAELDRDGNSYQLRALADGSRVRVLKNFPSESELRARISPRASALGLTLLDYYWLLEYRLK